MRYHFSAMRPAKQGIFSTHLITPQCICFAGKLASRCHHPVMAILKPSRPVSSRTILPMLLRTSTSGVSSLNFVTVRLIFSRLNFRSINTGWCTSTPRLLKGSLSFFWLRRCAVCLATCCSCGCIRSGGFLVGFDWGALGFEICKLTQQILHAKAQALWMLDGSPLPLQCQDLQHSKITASNKAVVAAILNMNIVRNMLMTACPITTA